MTIFGCSVIWAMLGHVDIVAVADGRIVPTDHTKVIQPLETGVVSAIWVRDGQSVRAGDPLIDLDPTVDKAELAHLVGDRLTARMDVARLGAMLDSLSNPRAEFMAPDGASRDEAWAGRQYSLGQVAAYQSKIAALTADEAERQAEFDSPKVAIGKTEAVLPMIEERLQMKKTLHEHENGSKLAYLDALQDLVGSQKDLDLQTSRVREAGAAANVIRARREEMQAEYRRSVLSDLVEARRKVAGLEHDVAKAEARTRFQALTAPIDGMVQQLVVHTIGGVVTPGERLLSVVPADIGLEIEATVDNQDIGFVRAGQSAEIKIDAFDFTRYGLRHGTVMTVSRDAIAPDDGKVAAAESRPQPLLDGEAQTRAASYAARVSLDEPQMLIDEKLVKLSPGMAVKVEVKTGRRRIIEYLLSPVLRHTQEGLRER